MKKVAIFASGSGTNAQNIAEYFRNSDTGRIHLILSNNPEAYVLNRAANMGIPTYIFDRGSFYNTSDVLDVLLKETTDFIVLAGFLWLVPVNMIKAFPKRIINIHPALLPKYGGKGMYGISVHSAVIRNKDKESGITIHYVNERYDEGSIIFQTRCPVLPDDTPETLAERVHHLEYIHYPGIIEKELLKLGQ